MHEAIITRGHVRGNPELKPLIMVRYNCVLVHPGYCHEQVQNTDEGKRKVIVRLIEYEGLKPIIVWLETMEVHMTTDTPGTAKRLINEVNNEMQGL